ncbi:MAG: 5'-nucleotidase [Turicibacter sp.]
MEKLVIGISSEALFRIEDSITFTTQLNDGLKSVIDEEKILAPGPAFSFITAILELNLRVKETLIEVIVLSKRSPDFSIILFDSLDYYGLPMTRGVFTSGDDTRGYIDAFNLDLFISEDKDDVAYAIKQNRLSVLTEKKSLEKNKFKVAFDHRIFLNEGVLGALSKLLPVIGFVQKLKLVELEVALVTTRFYSVDSWIKELFVQSKCKINATLYLGYSGKAELVKFYQPDFYFELQEIPKSRQSEKISDALMFI